MCFLLTAEAGTLEATSLGCQEQSIRGEAMGSLVVMVVVAYTEICLGGGFKDFMFSPRSLGT